MTPEGILFVILFKLFLLPVWCFRMWDVDDSGCINLKEMTNIMATMDDLEGAEEDPKVATNYNTRFNICQYLVVVFQIPALSVVMPGLALQYCNCAGAQLIF